MSVSVRCPECEVTCEVPPELLGRTGRCNQCGRRIRLATPLAELIDESSTATAAHLPPVELAPLDGLGELEPLGDLSPLDAPPPAPSPSARTQPISPPALKSVARQPAAKPAPRPQRAPTAPQRGPSKVLLALLALVGLIGGGAGGALLVKYLVPPEQPQTESVAVDPPAPTPPTPAPEPQPPEPKPPEPKPPEPQPPEPKPPEPKPKPPEPKPALAGPKNTVKLPGVAVALAAGGGGRFIVFQLANGDVTVYDNQLGRPFWTINGGKPEDLIAVSRTKLFLGRVKDAQIARFDLATGAGEGAATMKGAAATLTSLAIGSASDGPLLVVTRGGPESYRFRLVEPIAFNEVAYPIDDPQIPAIRGFPFGVTSPPQWVAASADGRALMLGNRFHVRSETGYWAGLLPGVGSAQHLPTTDGQSFVGSRLYDAAANPLPPAELPPGFTRRYIPAASGPFVVSAEYKFTDPSVVKLWLHLGADPKPLGPLPGGEEVAAWAQNDRAWVSKLHQRLIFAPDPGLLIFCPPGAESAQFYPINLPAVLGAAGRDIAFTSTPPAEFQLSRPYTYRATAAAARGAATFTLEAGPPGMTVTRDGLLTWPQPVSDRQSYEVTIAASDGRGGRTVQTFRLMTPRKDAVVDPPKKGPQPDPPKLPPEGPPPKEPKPDPPPKEPEPVQVKKDPPKEPEKEPQGNARTVKLPAPVEARTGIAYGGAGRFVCLNLPTLKQIAVFDAQQGRTVKNLPTDEANVVIAAGRHHLFVVNNEAGVLQRWNLTTLEKEDTVKLPPGGPFSYAHIGSNSVGPLLLCPTPKPWEPIKPLLVDAVTLREVPEAAKLAVAMPHSIRASADGLTFSWGSEQAASGAVVATVADGKVRWQKYPEVANPLLPGPAGRFFYAATGVYDNRFNRIRAATGLLVPSAQGNLYLEVERTPPGVKRLPEVKRASVFIEGQFEPLATIDHLSKPFPTTVRVLHLVPRYGLLVTLNVAADELVLHPFDLDAALAKSNADYLIVLPDAPPQPVAGARFEFAPMVKSKRGGVVLKLDTGPEGMKIEDGRLVWDVPADGAGRDVSVVFTVSDASGEKVPTTFRLTVAARPAPKVP